MPDDDDWRFRKAQQLGLIDPRPLGGSGDGRRSAPPPSAPPREPTPPRRTSAESQQARAPSPQARPAAVGDAARRPPPLPLRPGGGNGRRLAMIGGTAAALLAAAAGGWALNDAIDPVLVAVAPRAAPGPPPAEVRPAPPPAVVLPAPVPIEAPLPPATVPPPSVELPTPQPIASPPPTPAVVEAARPLPVRAAALPVPRGTARKADEPSFNCRRARTRDSRLICATPDLAALDREMALAYRAAVQRGGARSEVRLDSDQAAFLNARAACQSAACIGRLYVRRLDALDR